MGHRNTMGNEVVKGFKCKPKDFDPNKPMMHYKTQIFLCSSPRCESVSKESLADELRELVREMGLHKGKNRIKITRSRCFGACRHKQVLEIVENTKRNGFLPNNGVWLKEVHLYDKEKWKKLFKMLSENKEIKGVEFKEVPIKEE